MDNYNLRLLYAEQWSNIRPFLARVFNQLIKVLNMPPFMLPRYILIMLDKDLITSAELFNYGVLQTMEDTLKWLLKKINQVIETRKQDLMGKRPGVVSTTSEPRLVWVTMLRRPDKSLNKQVHALVRKFNKILEQVISVNQRSHFLKMDLETTCTNYELIGNLTQIGKLEYWKKLDATMKDLDRGKTELEPSV